LPLFALVFPIGARGLGVLKERKEGRRAALLLSRALRVAACLGARAAIQTVNVRRRARLLVSVATGGK